METTDRTDEALAMETAREGSDGPAFVALVERFRARVWRVCYRLLSNEQDAHDAAQEVFLRLFLQRQQFEGRSKYATWVHGIAIRICLTMRRGRSRRQRHETVTTESLANVPQNGAAESAPGAKLDLLQMLDTLDDEDRAILLMKYAEGHEYEELAEIFGLGVSALKMRVSRAREKLRERFPEMMI